MDGSMVNVPVKSYGHAGTLPLFNGTLPNVLQI